jgi:ketosteroid isomerase-like protein
MSNRFLAVLGLLLSTFTLAQGQPAAFDGINQWKAALAAADMAALKNLYSTSPAAEYMGKDKKPVPGIAPETDFWQKLVASGASGFEVGTISEGNQEGLHVVSLAVSMKMQTPEGPRTRYVMEQQAWQPQGGQWRIVVASHSDVVKMRPALKRNPNLYRKDANAGLEIGEAVTAAAKNHQRVILVFGANWCYDCHVLDQAFHQPDVAPLLEKNFRVVHVDIGDDGKKNNDLAAKYEVPLAKGVPALAILGPDGKLLYSQKGGEWEAARSLDPDDIIAFLKKWRP